MMIHGRLSSIQLRVLSVEGGRVVVVTTVVVVVVGAAVVGALVVTMGLITVVHVWKVAR